MHPSPSATDGALERQRDRTPLSIVPLPISQGLSEGDQFGPWGPERVLLFGRAGSGKSTLAQMLTLGKLDKENETFVPHSGIRGGTATIQPGEARGWYVVDTPGFGDPVEKKSTISTRDVQEKIKNYVRLIEGSFSHFLYVAKKDRLDILEEKLWEFFMKLFGEEIKRHFTVVVSGADEEWIDRNIKTLQSTFKGCESFLSADFPAIDEKDEELEIEYQILRRESLMELEAKLAQLARHDVHCSYGRSSKVHIRIERVRAYTDLGVERNERIKFLVRGASMLFACCNISRRPWAELTNLLTVDDKIILIPE
jgi:GTP-binding protein EngB required for normal cell division